MLIALPFLRLDFAALLKVNYGIRLWRLLPKIRQCGERIRVLFFAAWF